MDFCLQGLMAHSYETGCRVDPNHHMQCVYTASMIYMLYVYDVFVRVAVGCMHTILPMCNFIGLGTIIFHA